MKLLQGLVPEFKLTILALIVFFFRTGAYAQTDTAFWFAAPECSVHTQFTDRPILFRLFSFNQPANITITQPANSSFTPRTVSIPAYSSVTIDLTSDIDQIENKPSGQVLNYGLKISSSALISAYYEVLSEPCKCNPEIFALKGNNALGTSFYVPGQNIFDNVGFYVPSPKNHFIMVATEDNTTVSIRPSCNLINYSNGQTFTVTLNKGQTYSCEALSQSAGQHCEGSVVTSDKPIALTFNDDLLVNNVCYDQIGDQVVPNNLLGKEYIVTKGRLNSNDFVRIISTENATLTIDNVTNITLTKGVPYGFTLTAGSTYLKADQPFQVHQITGTNCELASAIIPKLECAGSRNITIVRSSDLPLYITIVILNGFQNFFLINGSGAFINGSDFSVVPGTNSKYVSALIDLSSNTSVNQVLAITNSKNVNFQLGILNGGQTGSRYGYFSNFSSGNFTLIKDKDFLCEGDSVKITVVGADSVIWMPANMFSGDSLRYKYVKSISNVKPQIVGKSNAGCSDTLTFTLQQGKKDTILLVKKYCDSSVIRFLGATITKSGNYMISKSNSFGCDTVYSLNVSMNAVNMMLDTLLCAGDSLIFKGVKYGSPFNSTLYLTRSDGCDTSVSIRIGPAEIKNDYNASVQCLGIENMLSSTVKNSGTYLWNTGETTASIRTGQTGVYYVRARTSKCAFTVDTFYIITGDNINYFPDAFTPNDDQINEVYPFLSNNILKIEIYNRWGELIHRDDTPPAYWDGKKDEELVETDVYMALITYKNCNVPYKQYKYLMFHLLY